MANVSQEQNALREMIAAFRVSELQLLLGKIFLLYYILSVTLQIFCGGHENLKKNSHLVLTFDLVILIKVGLSYQIFGR